MVSRIPLAGKYGRGRYAPVDDGDFERLSAYHWQSLKHGYAVRYGDRIVYMHREITQAPRGVQVDHINHDTLDNRRENLRLVTSRQNSANASKIRSRNGRAATSKYKGVTYSGGPKPWRAYAGIYRRRKHLGQFATERLAALAYDRAARLLFGEYAALNFPEIIDYSGVPELGPWGQSGFYGVTRDNRKHPWQARIQVNGRRVRIGRFENALDAALAYDEAARRLHGINAKLNFPEGDDGTGKG